MARYQVFSAIAAVLMILGIAPGAEAQPGRYSRYNNPGDRIGTPGFSQPIFMPSRRNSYPGDRYGDSNYGYSYGRDRRGSEALTIINGGNNCIDCRVNGWGRPVPRGQGHWQNQNQYPRNIRIVY
jgi:hypothetical protein